MIKDTRLYSGSLIGMSEKNRHLVEANPHIRVKLDSPVNEERLKKALEETVRDCPFLSYNVVPDEGLFLKLEENPLPLVLSDHESQDINTKENNLHSVIVYYKGDSITISITHALTDGCGIFWAARTLLDHYFGMEQGAYHFSDEPDYDRELMASELPVSEEYREMPKPDGSYLTFQMSEDKEECESFILKIPYAGFKEMCGKWNASGQTALTILSLKALASAFPEGYDHVSVRMPVNARNLFDAPHTFQNASIANMRIFFDVDEINAGEADIAKKTADGIKKQSGRDPVAHQFNEWRKVLYAKDPGERMKLIIDLMGQDAILVSYLGKELVGASYAEHVIGVYAGAAIFPLMVYGSAVGDSLYISGFDACDGRKYKKELITVLERYGTKAQEIII